MQGEMSMQADRINGGIDIARGKLGDLYPAGGARRDAGFA